MELNNKRITNAWCMYDWANSVYSLTITTAVFPIYYEVVTTKEDGSTLVDFFGMQFPNTVLYSYALSFSFLFTALILPLLTGIADYSGKKRLFLKMFVYLGALACGAMYFFDGDNVTFGIMMAIVASVGYSGSLVFYDAYLPEIATPDRFDKLSAKGYSLGYIGSVILLILNLAMITMPQTFGMEEGSSLPSRISFVTVALWWIGFSQIPFTRLPKNPFKRKADGSWLKKGYEELRGVYGQIKQMPNVQRFVLAFFFYNAGVQAVMYLATLFGSKELKMETEALIGIVLIIQLVAIGGAYLFAQISQKKGNVYSLVSMIFIWIAICLLAFFVSEQYQFFALAVIVGLVMGGVQSLSRATYSKLIPVDTKDHASFFSFYDVTFNVSIVAGTIAYGSIEWLTGSMRYSALGLSVFFIIGLLLLRKVVVPKV
ncbi:MFS transporter [Roseivirga pacifica]|uniref:MFS transporter n=1 Tax=Roseivirga pacifica TaxID=1267423 RepID=UPI0020959A16|nr:MFS transporter [Roseivirga pacifica]MCO6357636.1 MFS transporter [Roseivirga pacifica]MCO6365889.1 MFS transporter [Roseivirga pacifica]MCO6371217.1 MFS transporter [Roseivirga pacifica]MCO6375612.1 MFS transporter [Roseivirga pacifica]MCO6378595.1 MFS transporter [Roseivirga pacifica]